MFESSTESLLAGVSQGQYGQVIVIGEDRDSLEEMTQLLETLQLKVYQTFQVNVRRIHPGIYFGRGRLQEILDEIKGAPIDGVIFDVELSPKQLKNLESFFGRSVLDRTGVILEIFSQHARTKEAKTQVELARLEYLLPRLAHFWTHFERQKGGVTGLRGMGEKQIEVDRRLVRKRITRLKQKLKNIGREREVRREGRQHLLKVALVGYTNAGKSTLLNALTEGKVLTANQLFATLDSKVKALSPESRPPVVAVDTVGFIKNIPASLIASFRSTMEEIHDADLVVHILDAAANAVKEHFEVTQDIFKDLTLTEKPQIIVLNKADKVTTQAQKNRIKAMIPGAEWVSAMDQDSVVRLRQKILEFFEGQLEHLEVLIPYDQSKLDSQVHDCAKIEKKRYLEKGVFYRLGIRKEWIRKLGLDRFALKS